jgi:DNA-binding NtrC family response regulator
MSMRGTCGIVPGVPSVAGLRDRVRGWMHRESKPPVPRTILIVDANAHSRTSTSRIVQALGYECVACTTLAEALKHLEDHDPEFVLLGFELKDSTGLDALSQMRELNPDLAVIMLAADLWDNRVAEAMRKGAIAYLAQPYGMNDLREVFGRR